MTRIARMSHYTPIVLLLAILVGCETRTEPSIPVASPNNSSDATPINLKVTLHSGSRVEIPVIPEQNPGQDVLFCNLENNSITGNSSAANRVTDLRRDGFRCGVFISSYKNSLCLGVEKNSRVPARNVTMVPCGSTNGDQVVWIWNNDATLRPLANPNKCLTNLGGWSRTNRSFNLETCNNDPNQTWKYDAASSTIANSIAAPIAGQTKVLDRYAQLITRPLVANGSYKQEWITSKEAMEIIEHNPDKTYYPVKLAVNTDGSLADPPSVLSDRMKIAINNLLAPYGRTPYARDFGTFPGAIPTGKDTVTKKLTFDLSFDSQGRKALHNWQSTGLYAPPNQNISVSIQAVEPISFNVRIGSHTDKLVASSPNVKGNKEYRRSPIASTIIPITGEHGEFTIRSDIGGLILLESNRRQNVVVEVTISGAIAAPYYNGTQSQTAWNRVCVNPVPWGEIEGRHFVVTERSEKLCALTTEQLNSLISYYDTLVNQHENLAGFNNVLQKGKHRFVRDTQITAGYGHSGFPIMTLWDLVDSTPANLAVWGNGHELGHNYQTNCFASRFGGEVTVNLFTVHSLEKMFPVALNRLEKNYTEVVQKLDHGTLNFDEENKLFNQLIFLLQIKDLVGWESYQDIYKLYRSMSDAEKAEYCGSNQAKLDFFYRKISELAQVDFTNHFEAWKLPISATAKAQVAALNLSQPLYEVSRLTFDRPQRESNQMQIDINSYYRLTTKWQGEGKSLDIVNDAKDNQPILETTGNYAGQYWKLTPVGKGY